MAFLRSLDISGSALTAQKLVWSNCAKLSKLGNDPSRER